MKKIILLTLLIIIGVLGLSRLVYADDLILSVSPASLNSAVGAPFNVSVQLNPANNEVCVVKGAISFDNLTCQSITVTDGLYAAVIPTCASPSFTLGIPRCATTVQDILSVSVEGIQAGQGALSFTGVKVIGAGADVASSWQGGAYNIITSVQTATPSAMPEATQQVTQPTRQPTQQATTPVTSATSVTPAIPATPNNNILASTGAVGLSVAGSRWFKFFLIALIILVIIYVIYCFVTKNKKKGTIIKR